MTLSRSITLLLTVLLTPVLGGCATPAPFAMPDATPDDFVLALTVFAPVGQPVDQDALIPARYILEPNAVLRAAVGPGSLPSTYPSPVRTLSTAQIDALWDAARTLPLSDPDAGYRAIQSPEGFNAPADQGVYLVEIRSKRSQRAFATDTDQPEARALAEHLADLAWVQSD